MGEGGGERERERERQRDRDRDRETDRERETKRERQRNRQTQRERETDRQTDRHRDRKRERERERERQNTHTHRVRNDRATDSVTELHSTCTSTGVHKPKKTASLHRKPILSLPVTLLYPLCCSALYPPPSLSWLSTCFFSLFIYISSFNLNDCSSLVNMCICKVDQLEQIGGPSYGLKSLFQ